MAQSRTKNKLALFLIATVVVVLSLYLLYGVQTGLLNYLRSQTEHASPDVIVNVLKLILWAALAYLFVRAVRVTLFGLIFRLRRGYEAPTLARNTFSIGLLDLFIVIFNKIFQGINPVPYSLPRQSSASLSVWRCRIRWVIFSPAFRSMPTGRFR
jgi:uncharacterized protein with PQ loop repeat